MIFWDRRRLFFANNNIRDYLICTYPFNHTFFPILCRFRYKKDSEETDKGVLTITPGKIDNETKYIKAVYGSTFEDKDFNLKDNEDDQIFLLKYPTSDDELNGIIRDYYEYLYGDKLERDEKVTLPAIYAYLDDKTPLTGLIYNSGTYRVFSALNLVDGSDYTHRIANYSEDILKKCGEDELSVTVSSGVTGLGGWIDNKNKFYAIFKGLSSISSLDMPNTINFIDIKRTFYAIDSDNLSLNDNRDKVYYTLGTYAFNDCESIRLDKSNQSFSTHTNNIALYNKNLSKVYYGLPSASSVNSEVLNSVSEIGEYAFAYRLGGNIDLYSKDALSKIESCAFLCYESQNGKGLIVKLGRGFKDKIPEVEDKSVDESAFWGCDIITLFLNGDIDYKWGSENEIYQISSKTLLTSFVGENSKQSNGASAVFKSAFMGCENLEKTYIGDYINTLCDYAYSRCESLTTLGLDRLDVGVEITSPYNTVLSSENALRICTYVYKGCNNLPQKVTLPHRVYYIGANAFENTSIKDITFGNCLFYVVDGVASAGGEYTARHYIFGNGTQVHTMAINSHIRLGKSSSYRKYDEIKQGEDYFNVLFDWNEDVGLIQSLKTIKFNTLVGANVSEINRGIFYNYNLKNIYLGRPMQEGDKYTPLSIIRSNAFANSTDIDVYDTGNSDFEVLSESLGLLPDSISKHISKLYIRSVLAERSFFDIVPYNTEIDTLYVYRDMPHFGLNYGGLLEKSQSVRVGENCHSIPPSFLGGSSAFDIDCSKIIYENPDKIYNIGSSAFAYSNVTNGTLKSFINLERIDSSAFRNCYSLSGTVILNCKFIGEYAFYNCENIDELIIQGAYIESYAFCNCIHLKKLTLINCNYIGERAFEGCYNLKMGEFAIDCDYIGRMAFYGCDYKNADATIEISNCRYIGSYAFAVYTKSPQIRIKTLNIYGNGKTIIDTYAFGNIGIENIYLSGVSTLNNYAFNGNEALENLSLGTEMEKIGVGVFSRATALKKLIIPENVWSIGNGAFYGSGITEIECHSLLQNVGSDVFEETPWYSNSDNWDYSNIVVRATPLLEGAFEEFEFNYEDYRNGDVDFNELIPTEVFVGALDAKFGAPVPIGEVTYRTGDGGTASVAYNSHLFSYGSSGRYYTANYYENGASMIYDKYIGEFKFVGMDFANLVVRSPHGDVLIAQKKVSMPTYTLSDRCKSYTVSDGIWGEFLEIGPVISWVGGNWTYSEYFAVRGADDIIPREYVMNFCTIGGESILNGDASKHITADYWSINSTVTSGGTGYSADINLGQKALGTDLHFIPLADIDKYKFVPHTLHNRMNVDSPTTDIPTVPYTIDDLVVYIPDRYNGDVNLEAPYITVDNSPICYGKSGLKHISLPRGMKYITTRMFNNCTNVISINFDASEITEIGEYAFDGCSSWGKDSDVELDFRSFNGHIPNFAFRGCKYIKSIKFGKITSIGTSAFSGCTNLKSITFTDASKLRYIGDFAFESCANLKFNFVSSIDYIGVGAFYGCNSLTSDSREDNIVTLGSNISIVNSSTFDVKNTTIIINKNKQKYIDYYGFGNKKQTQIIKMRSRQTLRDIAGGLTETHITAEYEDNSEEITIG